MAIRLGVLAPLLVLLCSLCVLSSAHDAGIMRTLLQEDAESLVQEAAPAEEFSTENSGDGDVGGDPVTDLEADAEPMEGKATAEDTGEEAVSEVKIEAEIKAATEEKLVEEEEENNLPHGTPSWHPARAHNHGEAAEGIDVDEAGVIDEPGDAAPAEMSPATVEDQGMQTPAEAEEEAAVEEAVEAANAEAEMVAAADAEGAAVEEMIAEPAVVSEATPASVAETEAAVQEEAAAEEASEVAAVEEAEFVAEAQAEEASAAADAIIEQEAAADSGFAPAAEETLPMEEVAVPAGDVLDAADQVASMVERKRMSRRLLQIA